MKFFLIDFEEQLYQEEQNNRRTETMIPAVGLLGMLACTLAPTKKPAPKTEEINIEAGSFTDQKDKAIAQSIGIYVIEDKYETEGSKPYRQVMIVSDPNSVSDVRMLVSKDGKRTAVSPYQGEHTPNSFFDGYQFMTFGAKSVNGKFVKDPNLLPYNVGWTPSDTVEYQFLVTYTNGKVKQVNIKVDVQKPNPIVGNPNFSYVAGLDKERAIVEAGSFSDAKDKLYSAYGVYILEDIPPSPSSSSNKPELVVRGDPARIQTVALLGNNEKRRSNYTSSAMGELDIGFYTVPRDFVWDAPGNKILLYCLDVNYLDGHSKQIDVIIRRPDTVDSGRNAGYGIPWETSSQ